MKKLFLLTVCILVFLGVCAQNLYAYPVTLKDFEGGNEEVLLEITGDGTTSVTFEVTVVNPIADLRGIFFDLTNNPFPDATSVSVAGADVTDWLIAENSVDDLGGGVVVTPLGPFDVGVEIGTQGIGLDDIQHTIFTITSISNQNLYLGNSFAARLTSVGPDREGSSKLTNAIPEPGTILLLGLGLISLAGLRKKIKKH